MKLGDLEFKAEDFYKPSEPWGMQECIKIAERANALLAERLAAARTNAPLLAEAVLTLSSEVAALREALTQCVGAINTALTTVDVPGAREYVGDALENAASKAIALLTKLGALPAGNEEEK